MQFITSKLQILTQKGNATKKGWKHICMMIEGEDCQPQQTLINNGTITAEDQKVPIRVFDAIQTTNKEEEHFWHYRDEILFRFETKKMKESMH